MARTRATSRWRLLGALPLASGAALVVHVLTTISLGLALLGTAVIVALSCVVAWRRLPPIARVEVARRARAGLVAGLAATVAYDGSRWIAVNVLHDTFWPFDIYPIFGQAIIGMGHGFGVITAIGVLYHYTNGLCFGVAYAIILGTRGWWTGVFWALGLETLMLAVYPGWLHPRAFDEFVSISLLGHLVYGATLGLAGHGLLARGTRVANDSAARLRT